MQFQGNLCMLYDGWNKIVPVMVTSATSTVSLKK